jgi:hypothetical protein
MTQCLYAGRVTNTSPRALGVIAQYIDNDDKEQIVRGCTDNRARLSSHPKSTQKMFQAMVPVMLNVLQKTLEIGDTEGAKHVFDVFETMLILETPLLSTHIPQLVQFFVQCGANSNLDEEIRVFALNALTWTVQ